MTICVSSLGLSAQAIAGFGNNHPHDPSDLLRCIRYCEARGINTSDLAGRMTGRSIWWDRLLPHWDYLSNTLRHEMATATDGRAPHTYMRMRRVIDGGTPCQACGETGRGEECAKCKGTGRRSGGRCRARNCYQGAHLCHVCSGSGHTIDRKETSRDD